MNYELKPWPTLTASNLAKDLLPPVTFEHTVRVNYNLIRMFFDGKDCPLQERTFSVIAAYLHDVVEDTKLSTNTVAELFSDTMAETVGLLTHDKKAEDYGVYIRRIGESGNKVAIQVKLADIQDNLTRDTDYLDKHPRLETKYLLAQVYLEQCEAGLDD